LELTVTDLIAMLTHVKQWVSNLKRAKVARRHESMAALRGVIKAVRETTIYLRGLREGKAKSIKNERKLSMLWTDLSFELQDLGLRKLADRCCTKGKYWADPAAMDKELIEKAGARLADIESLANACLEDLQDS